MTNIFKRINDVLSANINDLIDRVEDPERMVKQIIREMEDNILRAREGVVDAIASEKKLQKELEPTAGWRTIGWPRPKPPCGAARRSWPVQP